jgi:hypothetical protein
LAEMMSMMVEVMMMMKVTVLTALVKSTKFKTGHLFSTAEATRTAGNKSKRSFPTIFAQIQGHPSPSSPSSPPYVDM